jgi:hypothetical protein
MRDLVNLHCPKAELIRAVVHNLSIHSPDALYEGAFFVPEAHHTLRRLESYHMSKHVSHPGYLTELRCIGARALRKLLCGHDLLCPRKELRCEDAVRRFCLVLHLWKAVESRRASTAERISSDGGALLLGATDRALALVDRFSGRFQNNRRGDLIEHKVRTLDGHRVFCQALGYEDLNDHSFLRLPHSLR